MSATHTKLLFVVEEDPTGGFTAQAIGDSLFTPAGPHDQLIAKIRQAIDAHFNPPPLPRLVRRQFPLAQPGRQFFS